MPTGLPLLALVAVLLLASPAAAVRRPTCVGDADLAPLAQRMVAGTSLSAEAYLKLLRAEDCITLRAPRAVVPQTLPCVQLEGSNQDTVELLFQHERGVLVSAFNVTREVVGEPAAATAALALSPREAKRCVDKGYCSFHDRCACRERPLPLFPPARARCRATRCGRPCLSARRPPAALTCAPPCGRAPCSIEPGKTYLYYIEATNAAGTSPQTQIKCATSSTPLDAHEKCLAQGAGGQSRRENDDTDASNTIGLTRALVLCLVCVVLGAALVFVIMYRAIQNQDSWVVQLREYNLSRTAPTIRGSVRTQPPSPPPRRK